MPRTATAGAVRSMSIPLTLTVAMPPSVADTVRVTAWPAPLRDSVTGAGHGAVSGAPAVVQVQVTTTGARYQPAFERGTVLVTRAVTLGLWRAVDPDEPRVAASPEKVAETARLASAGVRYASVADPFTTAAEPTSTPS